MYIYDAEGFVRGIKLKGKDTPSVSELLRVVNQRWLDQIENIRNIANIEEIEEITDIKKISMGTHWLGGFPLEEVKELYHEGTTPAGGVFTVYPVTIDSGKFIEILDLTCKNSVVPTAAPNFQTYTLVAPLTRNVGIQRDLTDSGANNFYELDVSEKRFEAYVSANNNTYFLLRSYGNALNDNIFTWRGHYAVYTMLNL